jgi:ribose-phosphate pyrophosphokinase
MIKVSTYRGAAIEVQQFTFSGGEVQVKLPVSPEAVDKVSVEALIQSSDDVMALLMVNEVIDRNLRPLRKTLVLPYLPYARQDRACAAGEAIGAKVFGGLINSMGFCSVMVSDSHSDVGVACINNCRNWKQVDLIDPIALGKLANGAVLVSPDIGASKKSAEICKIHHLEYFVQANKVRDTQTGEILETTVDYTGLGDWSAVIVDDICDGGRTFIELAKALREQDCTNIHLHVTHGIFSKGKEVFDGLIDEVTATYDWTES